MHDLLQQNSKDIGVLMVRACDSRSKKPASVLDASALAFEDTRSIIDDGDSVLSSTAFDFDDIIVNSRAYREVMQRRRASRMVIHNLEAVRETESGQSSPSKSHTSEDGDSSGKSTPAQSADRETQSFAGLSFGKTTVIGTEDPIIDIMDKTITKKASVLSLGSGSEIEENGTRGQIFPSNNTRPSIPNLHAEDHLVIAELPADDGWGSIHPRNESVSAKRVEDDQPDIERKATSSTDLVYEDNTVDCAKCNESIAGQFAKALGAMYHRSCLTCYVNPLVQSSLLTASN